MGIRIPAQRPVPESGQATHASRMEVQMEPAGCRQRYREDIALSRPKDCESYIRSFNFGFVSLRVSKLCAGSWAETIIPNNRILLVNGVTG